MTTQIKITANEQLVLETFDYTNPDYLKEDPVSQVTDAAELAETTGKTIRSIKGIVGSLVKKGLLETIEGGERGEVPCLTVTPEAVDFMTQGANEAEPTQLEKDIEALDALNETEETPELSEGEAGDVVARIKSHKSRCKGIRTEALAWGDTRAAFVALLVAGGIDKGTAGTQWAKAHREGV